MSKAQKLLDENTLTCDSNYCLRIGNPIFSADSKHLFYEVKNGCQLNVDNGMASVDVWNWKDRFIQSTQLVRPEPEIHWAALSIKRHTSILVNRTEEVLSVNPQDVKGENVILHSNHRGDRFWFNADKDTFFLFSLDYGYKRRFIDSGDLSQISYSPKGFFISFFNTLPYPAYYSYECKTGLIRQLTDKFLNTSFSSGNEFRVGYNEPIAVGPSYWFNDDSSLLVYDNYDIWKLDPYKLRAPMNLTNKYGINNNVKLRICEINSELGFSYADSLLIVGFNSKTKYNSFYIKSLKERGEPKLLSSGPFLAFIGVNQVNSPQDAGLLPLKAKKNNSWIVKIQSNKTAPNYYISKDMVSFRALTNYQPQINYNWLSAELISFNELDGTVSQGILYKPENFIKDKKYPLIINFYQQLTDQLFVFQSPEFISTSINIPLFVSNGYCVFIPDIHFKKGRKSGESAFNTILGALTMLKSKPFIDSNRIGINGHSFAGGMCNYIITKTNVFAAALTGAGGSDPISSALTLTGRQLYYVSRLASAENSAGGISIWQDPDFYLRGSPVLNAANLHTPLLLFHCYKDGAVPWEQGLEMFIAARRLDKPVWMLQYDNGGHTVSGIDAKDFTKRVIQFFDHFLLNKPEPIWMSKGIPAKLKRNKSGFEYDNE